jgi:hypothetical protein
VPPRPVAACVGCGTNTFPVCFKNAAGLPVAKDSVDAVASVECAPGETPTMCARTSSADPECAVRPQGYCIRDTPVACFHGYSIYDSNNSGGCYPLTCIDGPNDAFCSEAAIPSALCPLVGTRWVCDGEQRLVLCHDGYAEHHDSCPSNAICVDDAAAGAGCGYREVQAGVDAAAGDAGVDN